MRTPSWNVRRPPDAAQSSKLASEDTDDLRKRRGNCGNGADGIQLAAEGGKAVLCGRVERKVELAVISFVKPGRTCDQTLRFFDDVRLVRPRPRVRVGKGVHAGAHALRIAFVGVAARGPYREDGLPPGPLVPKPAEIVDRLARQR